MNAGVGWGGGGKNGRGEKRGGGGRKHGRRRMDEGERGGEEARHARGRREAGVPRRVERAVGRRREGEGDTRGEGEGGWGGGKTTRPPDIVEKIVSGQMRKFYEGACLTEQAHMVEEGGPKVSKALADLGLEVRSFVLVGMGK